MAIRMVIGVLGAGKGRYTIGNIVDELVNTQRVILTNFAIETMPWVNGVGKVQYGLFAYAKHVRKSRELLEAAQTRVFRVPDDIIGEFFLYRAIKHGQEQNLNGAELYMKGSEFDIYKAAATYKTNKDGDKKVVKFDTSLMAKWPMHYNIDEAYHFWPAREWDSTSKAFIFYAGHSRKNGDEVWLATHSSKDIDSAVVRKCQDFHLCVNRGKRSLSIFRQPKDIKVRIYSHVPTGAPTDSLMREKTLQINPDGIAECYDTTGGVGIAGRMVGDLKEKPTGLPFWMLIAGACLVPVILFGSLYLALRHYQNKQLEKQHSAEKPKAAIVKTNTFEQNIAQRFIDVGKQQYDQILPNKGADTGKENPATQKDKAPPEVVATGFAIIAGRPYAMLSDGTILDADELKSVNKRTVLTSEGKTYKIKPAPLSTVKTAESWQTPNQTKGTQTKRLTEPSQYELERGVN